MQLLGVDFTSAPSRKKRIVCAWGRLESPQLFVLEKLVHCTSFAEFLSELASHQDWLGAFDFPFGLPRELVEQLNWPRDWPSLMQHYASLSRSEIRHIFKAFCDARAKGNKFAHRTCDPLAGSSSSMKWVNPPVAYMLHAGVPLLRQAGITIAGLQAGDQRIAVEGYPGRLARGIVGNGSYKSDERAKQTIGRTAQRQTILAALRSGQHPLAIKLSCSDSLAIQLVDDASGDALDALLCAVQAAWASQQIGYGLPPQLDPLEGWIVSVPWDTSQN